jgi:hypothetical protein
MGSVRGKYKQEDLVVVAIHSIVTWDPWPSRSSNRYPVEACRLVSLSNTPLSQANPISLLLQPEGEEVTNTECSPACIASTQLD